MIMVQYLLDIKSKCIPSSWVMGKSTLTPQNSWSMPQLGNILCFPNRIPKPINYRLYIYNYIHILSKS